MTYAGAITGQVGQRGQSFLAQAEAERENDYNNKVFGQTVEAATKAALEEFSSLRARTFEERAAGAQEIRQIVTQSREAAGAAKLQALESGTGGQTVALLLADFERAELVNIGVSADNLAATERQLEQEAREAAARRNDRVAAARPRTVYGPYNTKLGIAGTFLPSGGGSGAYGGGGPTSSPPPKSSDE